MEEMEERGAKLSWPGPISFAGASLEAGIGYTGLSGFQDTPVLPPSVV
jgi:hypothetical protein